MTVTVITNTNINLLATTATATATTATATTATATTATATTATATTATAHYSMFEYYNIVENAFTHFFNNTIYIFEPMPKFSKKKITEMRTQAESAFNKERFEEITEKDIDRVAIGFAEELDVVPYELEEIGWGFIEEIAKRLCICPILLIESETYLRWSYDYFY